MQALDHLAPETYFDAWHTYVFDFGADGSTQVRVDGALTFETAAGFFDYNIDDQFAVLLGGRSYNATTNLYDSISVAKLPDPSSSFLLTAGLFGLAVRRRFERLA